MCYLQQPPSEDFGPALANALPPLPSQSAAFLLKTLQVGGPTGLPLQLLRVVPDLQVWMRRAVFSNLKRQGQTVQTFLPTPTLTQVCRTHPMGFGVQKDTISLFEPQAKPSCLHEHLLLAPRLHGCSLPCAASRVAPHEAIPLVDDAVEVRLTRIATRLIRLSHSCFRTLLIWRDPTFLWSGVGIGAIHRYHMITTDASMTCWGAGLQGQTGARSLDRRVPLLAHNCLERRAVFPFSSRFSPFSGGVMW